MAANLLSLQAWPNPQEQQHGAYFSIQRVAVTSILLRGVSERLCDLILISFVVENNNTRRVMHKIDLTLSLLFMEACLLTRGANVESIEHSALPANIELLTSA